MENIERGTVLFNRMENIGKKKKGEIAGEQRFFFSLKDFFKSFCHQLASLS